MGDAIREFFGFNVRDGAYFYEREPSGAYSAGHLIFVGTLLVLMIASAVVIGKLWRGRDEKSKNRVLTVTAIAYCVFEITRIAVLCIKGWSILTLLPFFLCSIPLFSLPLAAFAKGRLRESAIDFNAIFGMLIAVMGTVGAAQNYSNYPVISFENVFSAITHVIPGFAALFIFISGMASMKKKNIPLTLSFITGFCVVAYIVDKIVDYNYMFLINHDGTPYSIFYDLVNGNPVLYPLIVVALFLLYIGAFYLVYYAIAKRFGKNAS